MDAKKLDVYTTDFIESLPEGQRAELIDGYVYMMSAPSSIHQEIVFYISRKIGNYIEAKNVDCKVYPAPFAVYLQNDKQNYLEPDISVICDKRRIEFYSFGDKIPVNIYNGDLTIDTSTMLS